MALNITSVYWGRRAPPIGIGGAAATKAASTVVALTTALPERTWRATGMGDGRDATREPPCAPLFIYRPAPAATRCGTRLPTACAPTSAANLAMPPTRT